MKEVKISAMTEGEFLASGGSQMTIDLSHHLRDRITDVERQVLSLSPDVQTSVVLHTTALSTVMLHYYIFLCKKERRRIEAAEFMAIINKGMEPHIEMIKAAMEKEEIGESIFDKLLEKVRR